MKNTTQSWSSASPTTAILRVDTQESFTPEGGLPVPEGRVIAPSVNAIIAWAQREGMRVIDTVDIHPMWHISFASAWQKNPFTQNPLNPTNPNDLLWTDHSVGGTQDVELISQIKDPSNLVITKIYKGWQRNRDAYSGFDMGVTAIDGNASDGYEIQKGAKTLIEVLEEAQIRTLRIFGLVTEVCVTANALDALKNGFDIEIVAPACRGLTPEGHITALESLRALDGTPNRQGRIQSVQIIETLPE